MIRRGSDKQSISTNLKGFNKRQAADSNRASNASNSNRPSPSSKHNGKASKRKSIGGNNCTTKMLLRDITSSVEKNPFTVLGKTSYVFDPCSPYQNNKNGKSDNRKSLSRKQYRTPTPQDIRII